MLSKSTLVFESIDDRMVAAMRLALASSALIIIYLVPSEPDRYVAASYAALALYTVYSLLLYVISRWIPSSFYSWLQWSHWIDVSWYTLLVALSSGTNSIFFFGFLFSILVAAFRWGFASGMWVTSVSAVVFATVGLATTPSGPDFNWDRFLLRPCYMLVLGYMMSHWGGSEILLKHRLAFLREVGLFLEPRLSVDRLLGSVMQRLLTFYGGDACLLITLTGAEGEASLRRADRKYPSAGQKAEEVSRDLGRILLGLPSEASVVYSRGRPLSEVEQEIEPILSLLDAKSLITVPFRYRGRPTGRFYLVSSLSKAFQPSDIDFLLQLIEQITPVVENVELVDRIASNAAEEERRRIARDIHDSLIQPYIGLQIGLAGVRQKIGRGAVDAIDDVDRLMNLTTLGIEDLRRYIGGLKSSSENQFSLISAIKSFSARFGDATGISIQINADGNISVPDRIAGEVFQMITEALSNIRRHTESNWATISLSSSESSLFVTVENERNGTISTFTPRSIAERISLLGGRLDIRQQGEVTFIAIQIPLEVQY